MRAWLLAHAHPDDDGWAELDSVRKGLAVAFEVEVHVEHIVQSVRAGSRFEISGTTIRVQQAPVPPVPDVLFHATTTLGVERALRQGALSFGAGRRLFLSGDEASAWRAAHRLDGPPRLLVVDACRARRGGVRFGHTRLPDLFTAGRVPLRHVMNLRPHYAEQWSAGGLPIRRLPDGSLRVALVQVTRRSGTTWEIAKGKLEDGESPEVAAVREVREEMGLTVPLTVLRHVGDVRYGFTAPGDAPRLKTIFFFLLQAPEHIGSFAPREAEGITQVGWFSIDEAVRAVTHSSLIPVMARARELLLRYGTVPSTGVYDR